MAVKVRGRNGKEVTLLNPAEKAAKFARELKVGFARTNDGLPKLDKNHSQTRLTAEQRAYRSGYLAARKDSAAAYKHSLKK